MAFPHTRRWEVRLQVRGSVVFDISEHDCPTVEEAIEAAKGRLDLDFPDEQSLVPLYVIDVTNADGEEVALPEEETVRDEDNCDGRPAPAVAADRKAPPPGPSQADGAGGDGGA